MEQRRMDGVGGGVDDGGGGGVGADTAKRTPVPEESSGDEHDEHEELDEPHELEEANAEDARAGILGGSKAPSGGGAGAATAAGTSTRSKPLTYHELEACFHMPINEAAKELRICVTVLKRHCRKFGINRWPHRRLKSLDRMVERLEHEGTQNNVEYFSQEIESIRSRKAKMLRSFENGAEKSQVDKKESGFVGGAGASHGFVHGGSHTPLLQQHSQPQHQYYSPMGWPSQGGAFSTPAGLLTPDQQRTLEQHQQQEFLRQLQHRQIQQFQHDQQLYHFALMQRQMQGQGQGQGVPAGTFSRVGIDGLSHWDSVGASLPPYHAATAQLMAVRGPGVAESNGHLAVRAPDASMVRGLNGSPTLSDHVQHQQQRALLHQHQLHQDQQHQQYRHQEMQEQQQLHSQSQSRDFRSANILQALQYPSGVVTERGAYPAPPDQVPTAYSAVAQAQRQGTAGGSEGASANTGGENVGSVDKRPSELVTQSSLGHDRGKVVQGAFHESSAAVATFHDGSGKAEEGTNLPIYYGYPSQLAATNPGAKYQQPPSYLGQVQRADLVSHSGWPQLQHKHDVTGGGFAPPEASLLQSHNHAPAHGDFGRPSIGSSNVSVARRPEGMAGISEVESGSRTAAQFHAMESPRWGEQQQPLQPPAGPSHGAMAALNEAVASTQAPAVWPSAYRSTAEWARETSAANMAAAMPKQSEQKQQQQQQRGSLAEGPEASQHDLDPQQYVHQRTKLVATKNSLESLSAPSGRHGSNPESSGSQPNQESPIRRGSSSGQEPDAVDSSSSNSVPREDNGYASDTGEATGSGSGSGSGGDGDGTGDGTGSGTGSGSRGGEGTSSADGTGSGSGDGFGPGRARKEVKLASSSNGQKRSAPDTGRPASKDADFQGQAHGVLKRVKVDKSFDAGSRDGLSSVVGAPERIQGQAYSQAAQVETAIPPVAKPPLAPGSKSCSEVTLGESVRTANLTKAVPEIEGLHRSLSMCTFATDSSLVVTTVVGAREIGKDIGLNLEVGKTIREVLGCDDATELSLYTDALRGISYQQTRRLSNGKRVLQVIRPLKRGLSPAIVGLTSLFVDMTTEGVDDTGLEAVVVPPERQVIKQNNA